MAYEGNLADGWGNISDEELVRRFWEATCRGGYAGHGETYLSEDGVIFWSHGGALKGESPARIRFLADIIKEIPGEGLAPITLNWDEVAATIDGMSQSFKKVKDYYLIYYSHFRPSFRDFYFDEETLFEVEVIDTWQMTIERIGRFKGKFRVNLPSRSYMAIRMHTVVITGSIRGFGFEMAKKFMALDYNVVLSGNNEQNLQKALIALRSSDVDQARVITIKCNVTSHDELQHLWDEAKKAFGNVDIWVKDSFCWDEGAGLWSDL